MFDRIYEAENKARKLEAALRKVKKEELDELLEDFDKKIQAALDAEREIIDFLEENFEFEASEEEPRELYSDYDWVQPFEKEFLYGIIKERGLKV